ncbi:FUSC family protein [Actinomadura parmotrematis]|uniref:FUSC family protein n=1 Tax=Actinomadura parmotrematis TaxID=2864039 RepID=A0ABS7FQC5_9ACTN|nr:FUSC family protein [Actinomadura parmotrematis]MBW8482587.1 FUSC family protein [Actinomadura parmotrematis]
MIVPTAVAFAAGRCVQSLAGLHAGIVVLATALALTLGRVQRGHPSRDRAAALLIVPGCAAAAAEVGRLMDRHRATGEALFVLAVAGAVWIRRFGARAGRAGTLATLPFVALLIVPVTVGRGAHPGWWALVALAAAVATGLAHRLGERLGVPAPEPDPPPAATRLRPAPSTRLAVQMGAGLAAAFAAGHWLFPQHWAWTVLTAYIVAGGNRGRGDVAYKSVQRVLGAAAGTAAATAVAGRLPAGDRTAIVLIFVVLAAALWLRALSYAWWAAGITAALALLYGYFGEAGTALLRDRLAAICAGAAVAVAAAWTVLPIRTGDVVRRRLADALAELTGHLTGSPPPPERDRRDLEAAFTRLDEAFRPLAALRRGRPDHPVARLLRCRPELASLHLLPEAERAALRADTVRARRSLRPGGAAPEEDDRRPPATPLGAALRCIEAGRLAR